MINQHTQTSPSILKDFVRYFDAESSKNFIDLVEQFPSKMQERGYYCQITERSQNCQGYASFNILVTKQGHPTGDIYQMINSGETVTAKFIGKVRMSWE